MAKKRKPKRSVFPPPNHTPWPATVVGLDPGKEMGIGISRRGVLVDYADHLPPGYLCELALEEDDPVVVVIEHHTPYGKWSMKSFRTLQHVVGQLQEQCWAAGIPKRLTLCAEPKEWRHDFGISGTSDQCKRLAIALASQHARVRSSALDHNAAEGILLSQWGAYAARVGAALGLN